MLPLTCFKSPPSPKTSYIINSLEGLGHRQLMQFGIVLITVYDIAVILTIVRKRRKGEILLYKAKDALEITLVLGTFKRIIETSCAHNVQEIGKALAMLTDCGNLPTHANHD